MLNTNPIPNTIDYCCNDMPYAQCGERCVLTREQAEVGLNPLSTVPAQTWGYLWHAANESIHCIKYAACVLMDEINTVLCCAGITPDPSCCNQLYQALDNIFRIVGTAEKAGSVKSSSIPGNVSIDQTTGKMTANCVGNANNLTTACTEITGAINELKTDYNTAFANAWTSAGCRNTEKAPNNHASSAATYGVGNASCYGHLMITDTCCSNCNNAGMVASQKAVYDIWYKVTNQAALANTAPMGFGNASAGVAITASRSDHVHPRDFYYVNQVWANNVPAPTLSNSTRVFCFYDYCLCNTVWIANCLPAWACDVLYNTPVRVRGPGACMCDWSLWNAICKCCFRYVNNWAACIGICICCWSEYGVPVLIPSGCMCIAQCPEYSQDRICINSGWYQRSDSLRLYKSGCVPMSFCVTIDTWHCALCTVNTQQRERGLYVWCW